MKKSIVTLVAITAMILTSCSKPPAPQIYCRMDSTCAKSSVNACSKNGGLEDDSCAIGEEFQKPQAITEETEWITDSRDGKKYRTVKIGAQTWIAENLNYKTSTSVCNRNNPENCDKYGRLYNWPDAMEACPSGWHLPTAAEWVTLEKTVGGSVTEENGLLGLVTHNSTAGAILKSKSGWKHNKDIFFNEMVIFGNGTDEFGFSALPGGLLSVPQITYVPGRGPVQIGEPRFESLGSIGRWWTAYEHNTDKEFAVSIWMTSNNETVTSFVEYKGSGLSVRCLQD